MISLCYQGGLPTMIADIKQILKDTIDIIDAMNDDELNIELLPKLKEAYVQYNLYTENTYLLEKSMFACSGELRKYSEFYYKLEDAVFDSMPKISDKPEYLQDRIDIFNISGADFKLLQELKKLISSFKV